MRFPFLFVTEQNIEYIEDQSSFDSATFYCSDDEKLAAICIRSDGLAVTLEGETLTEANLISITELLKQQLVKDGHCCVSKLHFKSMKALYEFAVDIYKTA